MGFVKIKECQPILLKLKSTILHALHVLHYRGTFKGLERPISVGSFYSAAH